MFFRWGFKVVLEDINSEEVVQIEKSKKNSTYYIFNFYACIARSSNI